MKAFFLKLRQLIEGPPDPTDPHPVSSKRVFFLVALAVAIIATFAGFGADIIGIWLGASTAVAFGTAVTRT